MAIAFAGKNHLEDLASEDLAGDERAGGRERLQTNIRIACGASAPATSNAKRAAVSSAPAYFQAQD